MPTPGVDCLMKVLANILLLILLHIFLLSNIPNSLLTKLSVIIHINFIIGRLCDHLVMAFDEFNNSELKNIFDLCGPDDKGFISTAHLSNRLAQQFNDQALVTLQELLDPHQVGKISFEQFCQAVTELHNKNVQTKSSEYLDDDSSDPENTYNEYDIDDEISEMDNLEVIGESPNLSPIKSHDTSENFRRNSSFRRSHRRNRSWNMKAGSNGSEAKLFENACDETSSVASEYEDLSEKLDKLQVAHIVIIFVSYQAWSYIRTVQFCLSQQFKS